MEQKQIIDEVSFIRPILLIMVVLYHSFAPFTGTWEPFEGYEANEFYHWIASFSYSSMLETFVFVSGYLYAFQCLGVKRYYSFIHLAKKKASRLLTPYLVFGTIYIILFVRIGGGNYLAIISKLLNGVGHLWFLPMLFWCFLGLWMLVKLKLNDASRVFILIALAMCSPIGKGLQIGSSMYYIFFFFMGWLAYKYRSMVIKAANPYTIIILFLVYILSFILLPKGITVLKDTSEIIYNTSLMVKASIMASMRILRISYSFVGVSLYLLVALWFAKSYNISPRYVQIGGLCFGVYIFQQFILKYLYYYTNLPLFVGSQLLPWVGFMTTLAISILLTYMIRRFKLGRKML